MNGPLSASASGDVPQRDDLEVIPSGVDRRNFPSFSRETASETESAMKIGAIGSF